MASPIARNVRRACTKVFHHPNPPQVPYDEKIKKYVKHIYFYIFSLTPIPYGGLYVFWANVTNRPLTLSTYLKMKSER